jgi:L-histidine N-alpha-methyltransferase
VPDRFEHVARWDADEEWIEMHLRSTRAQRAHLAGIDLKVAFEAGELLHTEISAKFTPARIESELAAAGLELDRFLTDEAGDFALTLSRKA